MQHFEKLGFNLTPENIYMKEERRLKKHTDIFKYMHIYIYIVGKQE